MGISMSNIKEMGELESEEYEAYCEEVKRRKDLGIRYNNWWFSSWETAEWNTRFLVAKQLDEIEGLSRGVKNILFQGCMEHFLFGEKMKVERLAELS